MLLISARRRAMLYIYAKFREIILNGIKVIERDNSAKNVGGVTVVNLCTSSGHAKFHEIISNGIKVIEWTQFL